MQISTTIEVEREDDIITVDVTGSFTVGGTYNHHENISLQDWYYEGVSHLTPNEQEYAVQSLYNEVTRS